MAYYRIYRPRTIDCVATPQKIMTATEVPLPIRQAASIQFKTLINSRWVSSPPDLIYY